VATSQTRRGSVSIPILGVEVVKGNVSPAVLSGRTPVAPGEVALGRLSADDANVGVGHTIELSVAGVTKPFRVTGLVVVPDVGGTDQVGVGGVMTIDALHQLDPAAQPSAALVNLTPGVSVVDFVTRDLGLSPELVGVGPQPPGPIRNVGRVRPIPVALAVLMGVLAVVTVVNVLFTSIRRRRRQLAVMRAVGADRGWVGSICRWQAIAFTIVPAAIGSVLGVVAAAALFRRFADSIGAVDDASVPFIILAAMTVALVAIGVLTATLSAARELHHSPAAALRSE